MQLASDLRVNYIPPPGGVPLGLVWLQGAGPPVDGAAGTGHGVAARGSRYTDTTAGADYENIGTTAVPVWNAAASGGAATTLYKLQGVVAPVDGVTGAGVVGPGELYRDTVGKVTYVNNGTLAVPAYNGFLES